jgi:zinc transport system permease protein
VKQSILALLVGVFLLGQMRRYTLATLSPELANARGIGTAWLNYGFALLIAATVVVALKMLGALLLSALIVIPAAGAKLVSNSFRGMLVFACLAGLAAPLIGVFVSCQVNVPTGPTIVLANVAILIGCYIFRGIRSAA